MDGLEVQYGGVESTGYIGGSGGDEHNSTLATDERIIKISGKKKGLIEQLMDPAKKRPRQLIYLETLHYVKSIIAS